MTYCKNCQVPHSDDWSLLRGEIILKCCLRIHDLRMWKGPSGYRSNGELIWAQSKTFRFRKGGGIAWLAVGVNYRPTKGLCTALSSFIPVIYPVHRGRHDDVTLNIFSNPNAYKSHSFSLSNTQNCLGILRLTAWWNLLNVTQTAVAQVMLYNWK
jgi:hypothetical protein